MHFYGALILFVTLSAACGLTCYQCVGKDCTDKATCSIELDRCSSTEVYSVVTKSCMSSKLCVAPMTCCSTDLCNGATSASSILLLMASSAIITLFL
ncbi:uncharacterized protein ACO6RY_04835 [Pungitius sinensis]